MLGYATVFTTGPVFSLVLDEDVSESNALKFPELYRELQKRRYFRSRPSCCGRGRRSTRAA